MVGNKKAQLNFMWVILIGGLMFIVAVSLLPAIQGSMGVALSSPNITANEKFALYIIPFALIIFVLVWIIYGLRSGGGA